MDQGMKTYENFMEFCYILIYKLHCIVYILYLECLKLYTSPHIRGMIKSSGMIPARLERYVGGRRNLHEDFVRKHERKRQRGKPRSRCGKKSDGS
jgi:hypothetical protein